jgi:ABC-type lipoprotein export system ATPase subunit
MLAFENVTKIHRTARGEVRSLDGLNLEVKAGEFVVLRGPSGCGKTTLLLTAGGMLRPTSGRVTLDGRDLYSLSPGERNRLRAQAIGFVFQMFHLLPYLDVRENILLAARPAGLEVGVSREVALTPAFSRPTGEGARRAGEGLCGISGRGGAGVGAIGERVEELLHLLGLKSREHHRPSALSTGERQRAAIARALFHRPRLILADEPTGNLDPANATEVFRLLKSFHQTGGTLVLVTHGTAADAFADRVIEMRGGTLPPSSKVMGPSLNI